MPTGKTTDAVAMNIFSDTIALVVELVGVAKIGNDF